MITKIVKRDGRKVAFSAEKIAQAIYKAANSIGGQDFKVSEELADKVCHYILKKVMLQLLRHIYFIEQREQDKEK